MYFFFYLNVDILKENQSKKNKHKEEGIKQLEVIKLWDEIKQSKTIRNSDGVADLVSNFKYFNKMKRKLKAIHNNNNDD